MKSTLAAVAVAAVLVTMPAVAAPHEGHAFVADYDTNGDGQVTRAEFDAARTARFNATDANKDGWISEDEYVAEYSARLEKQLAASDRDEAKKAEERQRQIRQTHVRFGVLDTNKDGKIQKAEYDASGSRAFAGKDGIITRKDIEVVTAKHAAKRAERASAEAASAK